MTNILKTVMCCIKQYHKGGTPIPSTPPSSGHLVYVASHPAPVHCPTSATNILQHLTSMDMLIILIVRMVSQMHMRIKTYWVVYFKYVQFIIWEKKNYKDA